MAPIANRVSSPEFVTGWAAVVREIAGREPARHMLVNNAGAAWGAPLAESPESGFDKVMDLNVKAVFFRTRDLLPLLDAAARPGDPARVINAGSIGGLKVPMAENDAYPRRWRHHRAVASDPGADPRPAGQHAGSRRVRPGLRPAPRPRVGTRSARTCRSVCGRPAQFAVSLSCWMRRDRGRAAVGVPRDRVRVGPLQPGHRLRTGVETRRGERRLSASRAGPSCPPIS